MDNDELEKAFNWFNNQQWSGGKGDYMKGLFKKCDYKQLVIEYNKLKDTYIPIVHRIQKQQNEKWD